MRISKFLILGLLLWGGNVCAEVVSEQLPEMNIGTVGVETGVPSQIWGDQPDAEKVLAQIKAAGEADLNESEKEILKRVLMTDVGGVASLEAIGESYLVERIEALMAQGMFTEALTLMDKVPARYLSTNLKQLKAKVLFVTGRAAAACMESYMDAFGPEEAFIRAICADSVGVPPASAMAYEVYRESGADHHPFLNAAGEVLYRDMKIALPEGESSVWEVPLMARVWGKDIFKHPLSKIQIWTLLNQDRIPEEVRAEAEKHLKSENKQQADGQILTHLIQMAEQRRWVERHLKRKNAE